MTNAAARMRPLAAYDEVMRFAQTHGEAALRLAMHAAVPPALRPDLLHLLRLNFAHEAGAVHADEAAVLLSPLCEDLGNGYFQFDAQVRSVLLDNLFANYPLERVRSVARFILSYVRRLERETPAGDDSVLRDFLDMQLWAALAFIDPVMAARQIAEAFDGADTRRDYAARVRLGGFTTALARPLAQYRNLLRYAAGLLALETGDTARARGFWTALRGDHLTFGDVTLRPGVQVLEEWERRRPSGAFERQMRRFEYANIYLAEVPFELENEREEVARVLRRRGYYVLPDEPLPMDVEGLRSAVARNLERCTASVHMIGRAYGSTPEGGARTSLARLQFEMAEQYIKGDEFEGFDFFRVVWLPTGLKGEDAAQQAFIDYVSGFEEDGTRFVNSDLEGLKFYVSHLSEEREGELRLSSPEQTVVDGALGRPLGVPEDFFLTSGQRASLKAIEGYDLFFVAERLARKGALAPHHIAEAIFEFKRYMALVALGHRDIAMVSEEVDEVWHHFLVFTREYAHFCEIVFGEFIHHDPNITQKVRRAHNFVRAYTRVFGPPPAIWHSDTPV